LYTYSLKDIQQTVGAAGVPILGILFTLFIEILVFLSFKFLIQKIRGTFFLSLFLPSFSFIFIIFGFDEWLQSPNFGSEFINNSVYNKSNYFLKATFEHFFQEENLETDIYSDNYLGIGNAEIEGENKISSFEYIAENEFPFLHKENSPDVLGAFFKKSNSLPNMVFILVEGLGKDFSGENAPLGSFTPFLDSLATKSLYFENFLSEGGRTFAVLPSMFGSLPFAKEGFNEMAENMPNHISLMSILRKQGYKTSFYYGGNSDFDNMKMMLNKGGIDQIIDEATFENGYSKIPGKEGFSWGYDDKSLFKKYFKANPETETKPKLQILLTVSTHSPFLIENQGIYLDKFEDRMIKLGFSSEQKTQKRAYNNMFSTVLYADESLQYFFEKYKTRPDFENTIFIITGDHRMPELPATTKIDRFHVPLIIYSPLLTRTAHFRSISTHFDILPTILAFLNKNYNIQRPTLSAFLGTGIDTVRQFRNTHTYPIMFTKAELVDFVLGKYLLNNNNLYNISPMMSLNPSNEQVNQASLKNSFDRFKQKNNQIINGGKLLPDSILVKFGK
jgi:phosphoglycerol transferase MdoB-like AlkP superfamily enzyme